MVGGEDLGDAEAVARERDIAQVERVEHVADDPREPCIDRSASGFIGMRWLPTGRTGTTTRWSVRRSAVTARHSVWSMSSPCRSGGTPFFGPLTARVEWS